jgi:tetratricopeptide (TPR) repeat protein
VLRLTGDYAGACEAQQEALRIYAKLGIRLGQANALSHLGYVRSLIDDYHQAAADLNEALGIYRDLGDRLGQPDALNHLATVLRLTGDFPGRARPTRSSTSARCVCARGTTGAQRRVSTRRWGSFLISETGSARPTR